MKRVFGEEDRKKKLTRIAPKTPGIADSDRVKLEDAIKASLKDGFLPCPAAFGIAKRLSTPVDWVGDVADKLNLRIVDCQLGCFKVEKTANTIPASGVADPFIQEQITAAAAQGSFTCLAAFHIARRTKVRPINVAKVANLIQIKIHDCQLGCF